MLLEHIGPDDEVGDVGVVGMALLDAFPAPSPHLTGETGHDVFGQPPERSRLLIVMVKQRATAETGPASICKGRKSIAEARVIESLSSYLGLMQIFTIGYEGVTQAELIAALKEAGVTLLADIRAVPLSRRPGFSKNILAAGLRDAGIDYIGLKALGTPPEGREAARKGNHARLAEVYSGQLDLPEAIVQGAQLVDLAQERPTALLCFEREPGGCHRSLLIDAILPEADRIDLYPAGTRTA
jgi:hypothetical protein